MGGGRGGGGVEALERGVMEAPLRRVGFEEDIVVWMACARDRRDRADRCEYVRCVRSSSLKQTKENTGALPVRWWM